MSDKLIWEHFDHVHQNFPEDQKLEELAGLERYNPARFYREHFVFRIGHFGFRILELGSKVQLPTGSVLHIFDDITYPNDQQDTPRLEENIFYNQESFRKWIYHIRAPKLDAPIHLEDKFIYRPAGLPTQLMKFRSKYGSKLKYSNTIEELPTKKEALIIVNHNPLFRIRVLGRLQYYRRISLILASVFNTVHEFIQKTKKPQFIMVPWDEEVFDKQLFVRSRTKLSMATVKRPESFHYIFMMHLLNYMWDSATTSMFDQLPEEDLQYINLVIYLNGKYIFYNLQDLKDLNDKNKAFWRCCNQLNMLSVLGRVDEFADEEEVASHVKNYFTKEELEQFDREKQTDLDHAPEQPTVEIKPANDLAEAEEQEESQTEDSSLVSQVTNKASEIINSIAGRIPLKSKVNHITKVSGHIPQVTRVEKPTRATAAIEPVNFKEGNHTRIVDFDDTEETSTSEYIAEADKRTLELIEKHTELTPKQKERYKRISQVYKTLELGGEPIGKILETPADISLESEKLSDKVMRGLPDQSAAKAAIVDFDREYTKKLYKKHLAGVISSFNQHGAFLTKLKEERIATELHNLTKYTLSFEDINGKSSTIKFAIPNITRDGKILIDGRLQVLKKQRINLPFVKISDTEVSLASNYNKTLIIRNSNKAHNFFAYVESIVNSEKSRAKITFGKVDLNLPISYEYCEIALRFKTIEFDDYKFYFDYSTRLNHFGSTEEKLNKLEEVYGVYCGKTNTQWLFIDANNVIRAVLFKGGEDTEFMYTSLISIFKLSLPADASAQKKNFTEWVSIKILDAYLPVIFLLGYRYGLRNTLDYLGLKYVITERRSKTIVGESVVGNESFGANSDNILVGNTVVTSDEVLESDIPVPESKIKIFIYWTDLDDNTGYIRLIRYLDETGQHDLTDLNGQQYAIKYANGISLDDMDVTKDVAAILEKPIELIAVADHYLKSDEEIPSVSAGLTSFTDAQTKIKRSSIPILVTTSSGIFVRPYKESLPAFENIINFVKKNYPDKQIIIDKPVESKEFPLEAIREFISDIKDDISSDGETSCFILSLKASITCNFDDPFIKAVRDAHAAWERSTGKDSDATWSEEREQLDAIITDAKRYTPQPDDIQIKFADRVIWFNRYPLQKSLIAAGLDMFDLSQYELADFEGKDIYYQLLQDKGLSTNYLKGIDSFFDLFIDNMTFNILKEMHEPTNVRDLFIRAAVLLTTTDYVPSSAAANHRLRGFEQFNAIIYNEMARQFAAYQSRRGKGNVFSINPEAIYLRIISNASMITSEAGSPMADLRESSYMTYAGVGGRNSESFVVKDRKYAKDDIGITSEATVDNGKIGINALMSMDPSIANASGLLKPVGVDELKPSNALSGNCLVLPFSSHDDPNRMNFINIHSAHLMPIKSADRHRVRTGYERVIAHRVGRNFAGIAAQDGKVTNLDEKAGILEVTYEDGSVDIFNIGEKYVEFEGFEAALVQKPTVKLGDKFSKEDVLTYNPEFFTYDERSHQVDMSNGVVANTAIVETDSSYEDGSEISERLSEKLMIRPTNPRYVTLPATSVVHMCKRVGDEVQNTDDLLIFEDEPLDGAAVFGETDAETMSLIGALNKRTPSAKFSGKIVQIEAFYGCEPSKMHPTLAKIVEQAIATKAKRSRLASRTDLAPEFPMPTPLPVGTKYRGVMFDENTVLLVFHIQEELKHLRGDKLVVANQLKATTSNVFTKPCYTESGREVDVFFWATGINNRCVVSPFLYSLSAACTEKIEKDIVAMYFEDEK